MCQNLLPVTSVCVPSYIGAAKTHLGPTKQNSLHVLEEARFCLSRPQAALQKRPSRPLCGPPLVREGACPTRRGRSSASARRRRATFRSPEARYRKGRTACRKRGTGRMVGGTTPSCPCWTRHRGRRAWSRVALRLRPPKPESLTSNRAQAPRRKPPLSPTLLDSHCEDARRCRNAN